ncbi:MAG: peptidoglycan recognition protein [Nocardioidaceae bacterium]
MTSRPTLVLVLPVLGLVAGSLALTTASPVGASAPVGRADPATVVALRSVPGSPVREASRPVERGVTDLRAGFSMVAVTWPRGGDVQARVRAHGAHGWTRWLRLERLTDGSAAEPAAVDGTELLWVGPSDRLRLSLSGAASGSARVVLLDPGSAPGDAHAVVVPRREAKPRSHRAPRPPLLSRHRWGANERWRSTRPRYNRTIQQVHIHHTATGNDYRRRDVPGILRGIYRYHTHNLRWSDIGYNFLVDRFGRAWVGRAGGASKPVRGAHTLGFNNTSTGISVIGNLEEQEPSKAVLTTLVHLAAWKLDRYHRSPDGEVTVYSHGSDLYAEGDRVRLPVVDGHRDTNATACPGQYLYDLLPKIRTRAAARVDRFHQR